MRRTTDEMRKELDNTGARQWCHSHTRVMLRDMLDCLDGKADKGVCKKCHSHFDICGLCCCEGNNSLDDGGGVYVVPGEEVMYEQNERTGVRRFALYQTGEVISALVLHPTGEAKIFHSNIIDYRRKSDGQPIIGVRRK